MAITPLSPLDRTSATFRTDVDTFFASKLPTFVTEANQTAAAMSAAAAGTAFAIPYTFDSTTTDADPGAGKLRLSNATQNAATVIRVDTTGADGADWTGVLDQFDASSSTVKGQIRLVKLGDATKWLAFNVTARATPAGYRNITVTPVAGSSASPFANGDAVLLLFTRSGDVAIAGPSGLTCLATASAANVAAVDFTQYIDATYDEYIIEVINALPVANNSFCMRTSGDAGATWAAGVSDYSWGEIHHSAASPVGNGTTADTQIYLCPFGVSNAPAKGGWSGTVKLFQPSNTTVNKRMHFQGVFADSTPSYYAIIGHASRENTSPINGVRFFFASSNIASGLFKLYGIRKTV
jgi:hypothetical protein